MESYPKALIDEIKKLHPQLSDNDFEEYLRLIDEYSYTDPIEFPEQSKKIKDQLDKFVKSNLTRLEEAHSNFNEKMRESYLKNLYAESYSPVDTALSDEKVAKWLQEQSTLSGSYIIDYKLIRDPHIYLVDFKFKDDSILRVEVDHLNKIIKFVFQRKTLNENNNDSKTK